MPFYDRTGLIYETLGNAQRRAPPPDPRDAATVAAGMRRVRPCLMTSATTILALLPVLSSTGGRGAEIMIPMTIPSLGGMSLVMVTIFTVPVSHCLIEEIKLKLRIGDYRSLAAAPATP